MNKSILKNKLVYLVLLLIAVLIFSTTFTHDFAYDDYSVITGNTFTQKGFDGIIDHFSHDSYYGFTGQENLFDGGRYRPLSLVMFSIEYGLFGKNPQVNHIVNVFLFAFSVLLIFYFLSLLFPEKRKSTSIKEQFFSFPFVTSLLFAVHPIHTEVVANIKGRDEILVLLFSLLALIFALKYIDSKKIKYSVFSCLSLLIGLFSKENTAMFVFIIPITIWMFRAQLPLKYYVKIVSATILTLLFFILIRQSVLGGFAVGSSQQDNIVSNSFMHASSWSEHYGTVFYTWGKYLQLLIFPVKLTIDYYPYHISYIELFNLKSLIPIFVYLLLGVYSIYGLLKRKIIAYGILFFLITFSLVSNLAFVIGPFMGERFMYVSSLGFLIVVGYLFLEEIPRLTKKRFSKNGMFYFLIVVSVLFSFKTIDRNKDWKNNFTLYTKDVTVSTKSAVMTQNAGQQYLKKAIEIRTQAAQSQKRNEYLMLAKTLLSYAVEVNETNTGLLLLGNIYFELGEFEQAIVNYTKILKKNPLDIEAQKNMIASLNNEKDNQKKLRGFQVLQEITNSFESNYNLGKTWGKNFNQLDSAIFYLTKSVKIDSSKFEGLSDLGLAFALKGDLIKALNYMELALKLNPNDKQLIVNIGMTYQRIGNLEEANKFFTRSQNLKN